jgi:outer membrane protein assembly factor BamD
MFIRIKQLVQKLLGFFRDSKAHFVCNKQMLVFPAFAAYKKPEKRCVLLYRKAPDFQGIRPRENPKKKYALARAWLACSPLLLSLLLSSCANQRKTSECIPPVFATAAAVTSPSDDANNSSDCSDKEVWEIYKKATVDMRNRCFSRAAKGFEKVQKKSPFSALAVKATVMYAYCKYQSHKYDDALEEFSVFVKLYPLHEYTPYAYYMRGVIHYERIQIVDRDNGEAAAAVKAFKKVLKLFPNCDYAKDAKFKLDFIKNHIAAKEMQIGRFYQNEKSFLAAINRFRNVVTKYQTTEQTPEALLRLMECYLTLNMKDEFFSVWAVLKKNHSATPWCAQAEKLLEFFAKK